MAGIRKDRIIRGGTANLVLDIVDETDTRQAVVGTPTVTITDPRSVAQVTTANMTQELVGRWIYAFQTTSSNVPGLYRALFSVNSGTETETQDIFFRVDP